MSMSITFDTLTYANKLKAAGVESKVAEAQLFNMEGRLFYKLGTLMSGGIIVLVALMTILHFN